MTGKDVPDPKAKNRSTFGFLMWWKLEPAEIAKQVEQYDTLKVTQSARGLSLLLCLFSVAVTVVLGSFLGLSIVTIIGEAVIWLILGFFMYRAHRWAFVAGMLLWTFEKGSQVFSNPTGGAPFMQIVFWAIFMNVFLLGYRVERAKAAVLIPAS